MKRLGYDLNEHRVAEIFSSVKAAQKTSGSIIRSGDDLEEVENDGLNEAEFAKSLTYLNKKLSFKSLELIGKSWGRLLRDLLLLTLLLFLTMFFLCAAT